MQKSLIIAIAALAITPMLIGCETKQAEGIEKIEPTSATSEETETTSYVDPTQASIEASQAEERLVINTAVFDKFKEIGTSDSYESLTKEQKKEYITPVFEDFIAKGYITEYSFNMDTYPAVVNFTFSYGVESSFQLE